MKLSDNSISQLVRVLQLAILTGTDVTDNIRMIQFVEEDGYLELDDEYLSTFEDNLSKLSDDGDEIREARVPKDAN
tara:strand:- start:378 stop:605 length:228 start_codon:yes stop_codon:yes gene_type:complete